MANQPTPESWSYKTPFTWDNYGQVCLLGVPGVLLLAYSADKWSPGLALGILLIFLGLLPFWRQGFIIDSNSILQWSGPGLALFKKRLPAKEFSSVALKVEEKGRTLTLSLQQVSLRGEGETLRVAEEGTLRYDYLAKRAMELAKFLNITLSIEDEIIPAAHLKQDIRQRLSEDSTDAPPLPENLELERRGERTLITKPGLGLGVLTKHWSNTLVCLATLVAALVLPQRWSLQQPWFALLCALGFAFFAIILCILSRTQRLSIDGQSIKIEHFGGGLPKENLQMDLAHISHLSTEEHHKDKCLHFFGRSGRLGFGINSALDESVLPQLLKFVEHDIGQRKVSPATLAPKMGISGLGEAFVVSFGLTAVVLAVLAFQKPTPSAPTTEWAVSDNGTAFYYNSEQDGQLLRFQPNSTTAEIVDTEPLRADEFDVSGDGRFFVLHRTDDSGDEHIARYNWETREFLKVSQADDTRPGMAEINRTGDKITYTCKQGAMLYDQDREQNLRFLEASEFNVRDRGSLSADGNLYASRSPAKDKIWVQSTSGWERVEVARLPAHAKESATSPRLSGDGQFLVYSSQGDPQLTTSVVVLFHIGTQKSEILSMGLGGKRANNLSYRPSLDQRGHLVAFTSLASNLVKNDDNSGSDIFLYRHSNSSLEKVSQGQGAFDNAQVSQDGRFVFFSSGRETIHRYNIESKQIDVLVP